MDKTQHVRRLLDERDTLTKQRNALDQRIAAIDAEIVGGWHGNAPTSSASANSQRSSSEDDGDASNLDTLVEMIRAAGGELDYGTAAKALHGEDTDVTRKRIRSSLGYLSRKERIRNISRNRWEVLS